MTPPSTGRCPACVLPGAALKHVQINTTPYFPRVKEENAGQSFIEELSFLRFLDELPIYRSAFAVLAYYGGMRRGELLGLGVIDIDMVNRLVPVRAGIAKNGEARLVPIYEGPMLQWLEGCLQCFREGNSTLIVRKDGRPVSATSIYDPWREAAKRAGIEGFIPHDSRRSAIRNMRNEGIPQSVRIKLIGHKTDAMDRRYDIVDLADLEFVRERMNNKTTAKTNGKKKSASNLAPISY